LGKAVTVAGYTATQRQLSLLSIFAEHPDTLLFKLAPQIAEIFGIPSDQAQQVFEMSEFSQAMKTIRYY
jgi:hypothetical protein